MSYDRAPDAYRRISERQAPHNLYTSTAALWHGRHGTPPTPMFTFLAPGAPPGGSPATQASMSFFNEQVRYVYDAASGTYKRFHGMNPHMVDGAGQIAATNVVIQFVGIRDGTITDTKGQRSPETTVTGEGEAIVLRGGFAVRGKWVRTSSGQTQFLDASGQPIAFARGSTWIELLPSGRGVSIS